MDIYYRQRLAITVRVRRVLVYDGTSAAPRIFGENLPEGPPAAQRPPRHGTRPRVDTSKVAARVHRLPHALLGWVQTDGLPMVARVRSQGIGELGMGLVTSDGPLPPVAAERVSPRTRSTSTFHQYMVGQEQQVHTGWLDVDGTEAIYAPHTRAGYALPKSRR